MFADDTNLFFLNNSLENLFQIANTELENISKWFKLNKLSLNIKTNFMLFGSKAKKLSSNFCIKIHLGTVILHPFSRNITFYLCIV